MSLVSCDNHLHPGLHKQTTRCVAPWKETTAHRLGRWLEGKINPKQGRPAPECPACGNGLLDHHICVYCGAIVP